MTSKITRSLDTQLTTDLLAWYDRHHRTLPWRVPPVDGVQQAANPYRVWLSEIMLQQTTVAAVKSYYAAFTQRWPKIQDLAAADDDAVMAAWAGLGYYSRARNLLKCARLVANDLDGMFPTKAAELVKLPGIGPYTASAIAAICFGEAVPVVDGNVERVVTRLATIDTPMPAGKAQVRTALDLIWSAERPGDLAQAFMDLGASLCSPKRPACGLCPIQPSCHASATDAPERFPVKAPKKTKPTRTGAAFVLFARSDGGAPSVFLRKRPETGLLAGMAEVPSTDWTASQDGASGPEAGPATHPLGRLIQHWQRAGVVRHSFTHFHLELSIFYSELAHETAPPAGRGWWAPWSDLTNQALPNLMRKALDSAHAHQK